MGKMRQHPSRRVDFYFHGTVILSRKRRIRGCFVEVRGGDTSEVSTNRAVQWNYTGTPSDDHDVSMDFADISRIDGSTSGLRVYAADYLGQMDAGY